MASPVYTVSAKDTDAWVQSGGTATITLGPSANTSWATAPADLPRDRVR